MEVMFIRIYIIFIISSLLMSIQMGLDSFCITPREVREGSNLTVFGSIIIIIIWFIINPLLFVVRFVCWLIVGDDND